MNAYDVTQVYSFAQSAKRKFDRHGFTSLVLLEKDMHSGPEITTLLQPFDGVIEVERTRSGDRILRKIGVLHLKDTTPDPTFQILEMTESGMRVLRETAKPSAAPGVGPTEGAVLESQEERARRLSLIMQIASERLKLNSKDTDALFAMAAAQATLDDPRGGLQALDRLAELDPTYPGLWVLKTKLHARLGEADRARQSRLRGQEIERPETSRPSQTVPCPMCEAPLVDDAAEADTVVVNTCGFVEAAKKDSVDTLLAAADYKDSGRTQAVVAVGCLAERYGEQLAEALPETGSQERSHEWPRAVAQRAAPGRDDERSEGPYERAPRTDEWLDERIGSNERAHEWRGPHERTDERSRSHERVDEWTWPDERSDERTGADQWDHEWPRTDQRTDERSRRNSSHGLPVHGIPRHDADGRMEALRDSARRGRPPADAPLPRPGVSRAHLADSDRRPVQ